MRAFVRELDKVITEMYRPRPLRSVIEDDVSSLHVRESVANLRGRVPWRYRLALISPSITGRLPHWRYSMAVLTSSLASRRPRIEVRYRLAQLEVAITAPATLVAQRFGEARARRLTQGAKAYIALSLIVATPSLRKIL